jgi:hypothetical protein
MSEDQKPVVVTLTDDAVGRIDEVAKSLTENGMKVERVLKIMGSITGACAACDLAALRGVEGVADVSEDTGHVLPPPGSNPQ